jgi:hypothetical protein
MIIPFPTKRRKHWINRQINNVAGYNPDAAQRYLDKRIEERVTTLRRAGVSEELIIADVEPVRAIFESSLDYLFGSRSA